MEAFGNGDLRTLRENKCTFPLAQQMTAGYFEVVVEPDARFPRLLYSSRGAQP